jgi:hypothetical protein
VLAKVTVLAAACCAIAVPVAGATTVPVVHCPTTYGVAQPPPRLPGRLAVSASAHAVAGLDAYGSGVLFLLAPHGMHCHALVGADGSANIVVAAASTSHVRQPALSAYFADTPGTSASLACPLFASASRQLSGVACPRTKPAREQTSVGAQGTLYFSDPPHVRGEGTPSGGSYSARGAMTFVPTSKGFNGYAFVATCTLPASDHGICSTILADALTRIPANE